jgi:Uma2 family endonuclease
LLAEIGDSSLAQDRITKQGIYAAAGVPEYWIVNVRDDCVEILRRPDLRARGYRERHVAGPGETIELVALPGARVLVSDLLPRRAD